MSAPAPLQPGPYDPVVLRGLGILPPDHTQYDAIILRGLGILVAGAVMIIGVWYVFERLRAMQQGFGPNSLKALGIVIFVPTLIIVGIAIPTFSNTGEVLAALLGTVAGYVLSQSKPDEK